jgi:hypothetical protein
MEYESGSNISSSADLAAGAYGVQEDRAWDRTTTSRYQSKLLIAEGFIPAGKRLYMDVISPPKKIRSCKIQKIF